MVKKSIAVLSAAAMVMSAVPAFAEETTEAAGDWTYVTVNVTVNADADGDAAISFDAAIEPQVEGTFNPDDAVSLALDNIAEIVGGELYVNTAAIKSFMTDLGVDADTLDMLCSTFGLANDWLNIEVPEEESVEEAVSEVTAETDDAVIDLNNMEGVEITANEDGSMHVSVSADALTGVISEIYAAEEAGTSDAEMSVFSFYFDPFIEGMAEATGMDADTLKPMIYDALEGVMSGEDSSVSLDLPEDLALEMDIASDMITANVTADGETIDAAMVMDESGNFIFSSEALGIDEATAALSDDGFIMIAQMGETQFVFNLSLVGVEEDIAVPETADSLLGVIEQIGMFAGSMITVETETTAE